MPLTSTYIIIGQFYRILDYAGAPFNAQDTQMLRYNAVAKKKCGKIVPLNNQVIMPMKLFIKNMVCARCIMVVRAEMEKLGLTPVAVSLGEAELSGEIPTEQKQQLAAALAALGFELYDDKKTKTIEKIKLLIQELVHTKSNDLSTNLSDYLIAHMHQDYSAITNIFSQVENITIEQYYIQQKIEKVKELIIYSDLSLSQIAYELNYSSVAHLSAQFKKVTGLTPSFYKALKEEKSNIGRTNII